MRLATTKCFSTCTERYAEWLVSHSKIYSALVASFLVLTTVASLCVSGVPFFDDPMKDFITIGTKKSAKLYQSNALKDNTLAMPLNRTLRLPRSVELETNETISFCFASPGYEEMELWSRFAGLSKIGVRLNSGFAISSNSTILSTPGAIQSLCTLQSRIERLPGYRKLCSNASLIDPETQSCPIWSIPNFIASITGKYSCEHINSTDVEFVQHLYTTCRDAFFSGSLKLSCWDDSSLSRWLCPGVPSVCFTHPHLLLLLAISGEPDTALFVLPIWERVGAQMWLDAGLDKRSVLNNLTHDLTPSLKIEAIQLGGYAELSLVYVKWDSIWVVFGAVILAFMLILMTRLSFTILFATFIALLWSLMVACGIYSSLLRQDNDVAFPLLNMMALVLLLGLGADDILLFYQVWVSLPSDSGVANSNPGHSRRLTLTLKHAVPSVCLTSFSTLGGLLMSISSSIVAVKRFALYSSLTVLCHLAYVLLVLPILLPCFVSPIRKRCSFLLTPSFSSLADCILKIRCVFPLILLSVLTVSSYFLFYCAMLKFPSGNLQPAFYQADHPMEVYRLHGYKYSWAESTLRRYSSLVSLYAVWGVVPMDPRNPWTWTPQGGDAVEPTWIKGGFNITDPQSFEWLSSFCSNVTKMPLILSPPSASLRKSYLEEDILSNFLQISGCAYGREVFSFRDFEKTNSVCLRSKKECLLGFAAAHSQLTGLRFSIETNEIVGLVISFTANISLINTTFMELLALGRELETWFSDLLSSAPPGLKSGFLVSPELTAFEAYEDVLWFLPLSMGCSVTLAGLLILASTMNLMLALIALVSVVSALLLSCLLLVVVGGWKLGIVEGLILSLSAGLAVDPCIHFAVAIQKSVSRGTSWIEGSRNALKMVGCAVAAAAFSTALAGSAVLPSQLKFYRQMGLFLLILMVSSFLLCGIGFVGTIACLPNPCMLKCRNRNHD